MNSTVRVNEITTLKRPLQFLYQDEINVIFMDPKTYEQIEIPLIVIGKDIFYLKEGEQVDVLFWGERALVVDIPPKVVLTVL